MLLRQKQFRSLYVQVQDIRYTFVWFRKQVSSCNLLLWKSVYWKKANILIIKITINNEIEIIALGTFWPSTGAIMNVELHSD